MKIIFPLYKIHYRTHLHQSLILNQVGEYHMAIDSSISSTSVKNKKLLTCCGVIRPAYRS